jgi:hypothetical protein
MGHRWLSADRWSVSPKVLAVAVSLLGLAIVLGVLTPWKTADFKGSCVPANRVDELGPRVYDNHKVLTVTRGAVVTVQLSTGEGAAWPWKEALSSDDSVLAPVPLCANPPNITTVPLRLTTFKAVSAGKATITAPVKQEESGAFQTFVLTVTVKP